MAVPTTSTHHIARKFPAQENWDRLEKNSVSDSSKRDLETQPDFLPLFTNHLNSSAASTSEPPFSTEKRKIIAGESVERCTPWRTKEYNCDPVGLHEEIEDFFKYMTPRPSEFRMRLEVADRISQILRRKWPQADVHMFGSVMTGLFLPTSDIDLVVIGHWDKTPIFTLEEELKKADIAVKDTINPIDKTTVPVIKFTDKQTEVKVDICFNRVSGMDGVKIIVDFMNQFPILPKLVLVLKQFLAQRNLHEVFHGGISSYALVLLVVSFLQLHPRNAANDPDANLGVLLIEFFELFGRNFNYMKTAITVVDGGSYFSKEDIPDHENAILYIVDPTNRKENASRGCYGMWQVKMAFEQAFLKLHRRTLTREIPSPRQESLLAEIVELSVEVDEYRNWIDSTWVTPPHSPQSYLMVYSGHPPPSSYPVFHTPGSVVPQPYPYLPSSSQMDFPSFPFPFTHPPSTSSSHQQSSTADS
jgi:DNA polymerase sigma